MRKWTIILVIILSITACSNKQTERNAQKIKSKVTADEYKFVDVDTLPEKYVEKYLYTIKWKDEDLKYKGEYIMWYAKMDEKGNLYIIANENKKMYFYNEKGCLNKEYNLTKFGYFDQIQLGPESVTLKGEDARNGNLIFKTIDIMKDSSYEIMYDKKAKELYNEYSLVYRYILIDSANEIVFDSGLSDRNTIKDIEIGIKLKNRIMKVKKSTFTNNGITENKGMEVKIPEYLDTMVNFEIPENLSFVNFIGRDEDENIYILADVQKTSLGEEPENYYCYLFKYDSLGNLLSAFKMKNGESKDTPKISYTYILSNRDIYRVISYEDGIKVYKYEKIL